MLKKWTAVMLIALAVVLSLTACGEALNGTCQLVQYSDGTQIYNEDEIADLSYNGYQSKLLTISLASIFLEM